ncbi:MAG: hypothetical protein AMJ79_09765, partial [Phycisphaerae bacterium SM23_30]
MSGKRIQSREIERIIERQMRQWEIGLSEQAKRQKPAPPAAGKKRIDYITISRELGSGGEQIAQILSKQLGWQVYDKEILDHMAEDMHVHKSVVESVDERTIGWIEDWLGPIFTDKSVGQLSYYRHLARVLLVISRHGRAIIIGRAAGLLLPRANGLSVRVTAPLELRCRRYAQDNNLSLAAARSVVEKKDRAQKAFVRDMLNQDLCDCRHYDIVINTEKFQPESAAKLIWRAFDQRT